MKRILLLLILIVFVLCLSVGCGNTTSDKEKATTATKDEKELNKLRKAKPGDRVKFGIKPSYEMFEENSLWMGHPWKWIVLAKEDDKIFLLSVDPILRCEYDEEGYGGYVYPDSHVHDSLYHYTNPLIENETLFGENSDRIKETPIKYSVSGSEKIIKCQMFLLSKGEVKKYITNKADRIIKDEEGEEADWWLRSSFKERKGDDDREADIVSGDKIRTATVIYQNGYCRPACWVDISK